MKTMRKIYNNKIHTNNNYISNNGLRNLSYKKLIKLLKIMNINSFRKINKTTIILIKVINNMIKMG